MIVLGMQMVNDILTNSHLQVVKLENTMFPDKLANVVTVKSQGVSENGDKLFMRYQDFPNSIDGRQKATELLGILEAWNLKEEK